MLKTVSLCVVAYNEEAFLSRLLDDFCSQTYPHEFIEIVLVDGNSNDMTKKIMESFKNNLKGDFMSIKVIDNPRRIQAAGWNQALMNTNGDVIIRIDAHTHIPKNFVSLNMENIEAGESISGGMRPCVIEGDSPWHETLLQAENSMFGSSFNISRR